MEVEKEALIAVKWHTGWLMSQCERLTSAARGGEPGKEIVLELAIMLSTEGCGQPDSTGLGTRVSNGVPQELFKGKCSCNSLCRGCFIKKHSVQAAAEKTSVCRVAFRLSEDECHHSSRPQMQRLMC